MKNQRALQCIPIQNDLLCDEREQEGSRGETTNGYAANSNYETNAHAISQDDWGTLWTWVEPSSSLLAGHHPTLQMQSLCSMAATSSASRVPEQGCRHYIGVRRSNNLFLILNSMKRNSQPPDSVM